MLVERKEIETEYVNLFEFCSTRQIGIPIFQRFYAWKRDTTKQLLDDLNQCFELEDKQLYLLDIIFYVDESGKTQLADGQQRVVTINLLIKAINDYAKENGVEIEKIDCFNISYDIAAYNAKYRTTFDVYPMAPFKNVYLCLFDYVKTHANHLNDLIKIIKSRIFVFSKRCTDADEAFDIFQQINTGGKPLTKDEIIKTAIDQYSSVYQVPIETKKIKEIKLQLNSYYRYMNNSNNADFDNVAIMSFLKDNVTKDKESFRTFVRTIESLARLESSPISRIIKFINRESISTVLNVLAMKHVDVVGDRKYLEKVLIPLCMISIIMSIKGSNPTIFKYLVNNLIPMIKNNARPDDLCHYLIEYINANSNGCKIEYNDFVDALGRREVSPGIKKSLIILDIIMRSTSGTVNVDKINLEHVFPQKPDLEWESNGWPSSQEEKAVVVNNIGNYLILNEAVNKSISNKYINKKVVAYREIIERDILLKTAINTIDFQRFENEQVSYIKERQKDIAYLVREHLPLGKVLITTEPLPPVQESSTAPATIPNIGRFYHAVGSGYSGQMVVNDDATDFIIKAGAEIKINHDDTFAYKRKQEEMLNKGVIVFEGNRYILKEDALFHSPSGAASFLAGYSINGYTFWRNESDQIVQEFKKS